MTAKKIIFVTGTDTGVGKTLLTASLLHHLRQRGIHALGMKPFCSGGLADVRLLQSLQPGELSDAEANPFYFPEPIAPLVAGMHRKPVRLSDVLSRINRLKNQCDRLIIEGSGGLMVPLGPSYTVGDLIAKLDCKVVVVARNRLGTINHTLLTIHALKTLGIKTKNITVVLMGMKKQDLSARTNQRMLATLLKPIGVHALPFLGARATTTNAVKENYARVRGVLAVL